MKKITLQTLVLISLFAISLGFSQNNKLIQKLFGQDLTPANIEGLNNSGIIRCVATEYEKYLQENYSNRMSNEEFENWLAPKIETLKNQRQSSDINVIQTIPIIFHVFTDGSGAENLDASYIQAQVDQLNIDYGNTAGSTQPAAADTEIQFCLALQDENGDALNENGINRITTYGEGPFSTDDFENTVKAATQWDPTKYFNVWVANISGGILGYAHWPESSGITGVPSNSAGSTNDGVVVLYSTLGSNTYPNPDGGVYAYGRTLTHETGHWLGLRHIWGDTTTCLNSDYCADTPDATAAHYSCLVYDTCTSDGLGNDMVENYMDYTNDQCMDTFTADQKTRMLTVLTNSPRRVELVTTSTACDTPTVYNLDGKIEIDDLGLVNCTNGSITPSLIITNKGTSTLTSANVIYDIDGGNSLSYSWNGSLLYDESEIITLPLISVAEASHTFNVSLNNVNGGTDEQTGNNTDDIDFDITGSLCTSVANTYYQTSTEGVIFNTISNLNTGKPSGYSDYTSMSTDLNIDSSYDLSVYMNTDGNYLCITTVWIDWNQNCSFDDDGEKYDLGSAANVTNGLSGNSPISITVPNDAVIGSTTMRVTTKYYEVATSCENNHDGEVEDYTINIQSSLSVEENMINTLTIFPNPTTDNLTIKTSDSNLPDSYTVYNTLGQIVKQQKISNNSHLIINTADLSNGMYFLKIFKESYSATIQFIKN